MSWTDITGESAARIQSLFREEEERSEIRINYARFFIALLYLGAGLGVRKEIPFHSMYAIYAVSGATFLYALFMLFYLRAGRYTPALKYVSNTFDIVMLSVGLWGFGTFRTFKTEAFLLYFLWIALAAMRFSVRTTVYAGLLSVFCYLVLVAQALALRTIETGNITASFTTSRVSVANIGLKIVFMTAFFLVAAYVARGYYKLVNRSVGHEVALDREQREKEMLRATFGRYVTHQVADKILEEGVNLSGERRVASVLFCDIRNFTTMSEKLPPEEVVFFLNQYFSSMIDVVFEYGGTLDKFLGDALMAVFGAPVSTGRDEEMAVRAAIRMKEVLQEFNRRRYDMGLEPINIGIGIHTGEVIAGNVGSERRMEYTVIGKTVNLASRIESLNKFFTSDILITESTYEKVRDLVDVEVQPQVKVKGIQDPIQTYRVFDLKIPA